MIRRICFALDLVDDADLIAQYEAAHKPGGVWPEIISGIRNAGYRDMQIWRVEDRLFMIAEVEDDWPRPLSSEERAADDEWQAVMDKFQKCLPGVGADGKWSAMTRIFALDEHSG